MRPLEKFAQALEGEIVFVDEIFARIWRDTRHSAGTLFTPRLPNSLVLLVASLAIVWIPLRRSNLGLQFYAVGGDRTAVFRSGVTIAQSRFLAYVIVLALRR